MTATHLPTHPMVLAPVDLAQHLAHAHGRMSALTGTPEENEALHAGLHERGLHGNLMAESGCDRCDCGCKYWEHDRCYDCGSRWTEATR